MEPLPKKIGIRARDILSVLLILPLFLLFVGEVSASDRKDDFSESKGRISVSKFKMTGGSASLRALETLIPEALKAYLVSFGWSVEIESELVDKESKKARQKEPYRYEMQAKRFEVKTKPGFIIEGYFFESEKMIRIDTTVYGRTGEMISAKSQTFDQKEVLSGIQSLAEEVRIAIEGFVSTPFGPGKKKLAIKCFDFAKQSFWDKSEKYKWIGRELAKYLTQELAQMKVIRVIDWANSEGLCEASLETIQKKLAVDAIISGTYKISENNLVRIEAIITNFEGQKQDRIGAIEFVGSLDDFFDLQERFAESIKGILNEILTPEGEWKVKRLLPPGMDAEGYLAIGDAFYKEGNKAQALLMYKEALRKNRELYMPHFKMGIIFEENKKYKKAEEEFSAALSLEPNFSEAYLHLGDISFNRKNYEEASDMYKKALKYKPSAKTHMKIGDAYLFEGRHDEALAEYEAANEIEPNIADVRYAIGLVYSIQRNYHYAISEFEKALEIDPSHSKASGYLAKAYYNNGEQLIKENKAEEALPYINKSIDLRESAEAYGRLGWAHTKLGNNNKAEEALKKAIELDANFAWAYFGLGRILFEKRKFIEAVEKLGKAVSLDPKHELALFYLGSAYKELDSKELAIYYCIDAWKISWDKGRYKWAAKAMDLASEIEPRNAIFLARSGECYRMMHEYDKALTKLSKAVSIDSKCDRAYGSLGAIYSKKKEYEKAIENLEKAVELDPAFCWAYVILGDVYVKKKNYDKAIEKARRAIDINDNYFYAYVLLADVHSKQGKYDEAIVTCQKAIQIDPNFAFVYLVLGTVLREQGKYDEAINNYKKAIQIDPNFALAYNKLGYALCIKERYDQAYEMCEKAYNLHPEDVGIKTTFAEVSLSGHFDKAFVLANEVLEEKSISTEDILSMRMISISSLLFQEKRSKAFGELKDFIKYYTSLPKDYERGWVYDGCKTFIKNNDKLTETETNLILSIIDILESPKPEADRKLKGLESSLVETSKQR